MNANLGHSIPAISYYQAGTGSGAIEAFSMETSELARRILANAPTVPEAKELLKAARPGLFMHYNDDVGRKSFKQDDARGVFAYTRGQLDFKGNFEEVTHLYAFPIIDGSRVFVEVDENRGLKAAIKAIALSQSQAKALDKTMRKPVKASAKPKPDKALRKSSPLSL